MGRVVAFPERDRQMAAEDKKKKWQRFEVERAVRADRTLPRETKLVVLMLATYADRTGLAHPAQATLAADCGWSDPRSVRDALAPARGKYVTVHQGGDGRPATYCLTLPGERCGHDRLREIMDGKNSPEPGFGPETDSAWSPDAAARNRDDSARSPDAAARSQDSGGTLQSTKSRSLENINGHSSSQPEEVEIRTSEMASAAIRFELQGMPPMLLDVIEAIALELLGGGRNGLADWSDDGVTYDGLLAEIKEMSSPEVLRELLVAIKAAR